MLGKIQARFFAVEPLMNTILRARRRCSPLTPPLPFLDRRYRRWLLEQRALTLDRQISNNPGLQCDPRG